MQTQPDEATQAVLSRLLDEHHLTGETRFFREAERASLTATPTPGVYHLAANAHPSEAVIDIYGPGYLVQAELVEVRLTDLLRQGGRMYPVESVAVERVWYFTLPTGGVEVREVL